VHVPRRPYVEALPGIPTIRVFEALACGIPLSRALGRREGLFRPGTDFLIARDGAEMTRHLAMCCTIPRWRRRAVARGLETIRAATPAGTASTNFWRFSRRWALRRPEETADK
jgi:spore maturation protein CgeB